MQEGTAKNVEPKKLKEFIVFRKEVQFKRVEAHSEAEALAMESWGSYGDWGDYDTDADEVWVEEQ